MGVNLGLWSVLSNEVKLYHRTNRIKESFRSAGVLARALMVVTNGTEQREIARHSIKIKNDRILRNRRLN